MIISYANVTATLALVVALGGTSYAAVHLSQGQVTSKYLATNAVTGPKIKDGSISAVDLAPEAVRPMVIRQSTNASGLSWADPAERLAVTAGGAAPYSGNYSTPIKVPSGTYWAFDVNARVRFTSLTGQDRLGPDARFRRVPERAVTRPERCRLVVRRRPALAGRRRP